MKLYAIFKDVGSEYETFCPVSISLNPKEIVQEYKNNWTKFSEVKSLDLDENTVYNCLNVEENLECWKPYFKIEKIYKIKKDGKFIEFNGFINITKDLEELYLCKEYIENKLINEYYESCN